MRRSILRPDGGLTAAGERTGIAVSNRPYGDRAHTHPPYGKGVRAYVRGEAKKQDYFEALGRSVVHVGVAMWDRHHAQWCAILEGICPAGRRPEEVGRAACVFVDTQRALYSPYDTVITIQVLFTANPSHSTLGRGFCVRVLPSVRAQAWPVQTHDGASLGVALLLSL